jgi:hypothetical protein
MVDALATAQAACEHVRPDLLALVPPATVGADVTHAVILYAALLYRERTSPQGFSVYESFDTAAQDFGSAIYNIRQLLGSRKPVAR